jgi:hypothetical protein
MTGLPGGGGGGPLRLGRDGGPAVAPGLLYDGGPL